MHDANKTLINKHVAKKNLFILRHVDLSQIYIFFWSKAKLTSPSLVYNKTKRKIVSVDEFNVEER
ncbi:hypothetical protein GCM10022257_01260 [Hyunsoonleella aestuarii]|uniref:Uncharacterized protein n=1 Tax=Hyunsoonleella aestuarii TaxID=912802 RepID=A0ABP8E711_9FLAO